METKNKQWTCHSATPTGIHGQLRPEDLSANRNGQNRTENINRQDVLANNDKQSPSDIFNKKGLDQFLAQQVENSICENSRKTISQILEEIGKLTSTEKLLLYLKLPTDLNTVSDPLRQPLNPLGSRSEISQTIMWIRTHLEEDPELSLPKQEVYNEYTVHCANNKMKPLSTADFGKVMKQVYPSVRPRRLGTRGNSRYCYAGLRKRFKLEVPQLPDLGDRPKSTEHAGQSPSDLTAAAWYIVQKWAEDVLGTSFVNVCSLALYLVKNVCPMFQTHSAAAAICNMDADGSNKGESQDLTVNTTLLSLKHKETQIQLQKKLQQREVTREQKRKLQVSVGKTVETVGKSNGKCKKSKISPTNTEKPTTIVSDTETSKESTPLPDFNNFQVKNLESPEIKSKNILQKPSSTPLSRSSSIESDIYDINQIGKESEVKPNIAGKLPLPRLPNIKSKHPLAPPKTVILAAPKSRLRNQQKYKNIQPKLTKCDNYYAQERNQTQVEASDVLTQLGDDQLKDIDILTRERLISVSNVDKDALDDYLHGGNNSQEQEEELLQYFKNNNSNSESMNEGIQQSTVNTEDEHSNSSKSDKLSQLRLLLEQNLNPQTQQSTENQQSTFVKVEKPPFAFLPSTTINLSGSKRRVSFETSILEEPVPPSPNTRRKNYNFTPISPGPHSPGGRQSKSSSTNASPFVSPRNTPVPRSKTTSHTPSAPISFVAQQTVNSGRKHLKSNMKFKTDSELFAEHEQTERSKPFIPSLDITSKCNLPMSAPPSPMLPYKQKQQTQNSNLLQKLLDPNAKVAYTPDYEKSLQNPLSQEVTQLMGNNQFTNTNSYRSQSVPLHQMASNLMSPCLVNNENQFTFNFENNSVPSTPATEYEPFETFTETEFLSNGLNSENINQIFNILDTTTTNQLDVQDNVQNENIFNFAPTNVLSNDIPFNSLQNDMIHQSALNKPIRSQSIDEVGNISQQKFQLSRSVPSTPLPYKNKMEKPLELNLNLNNNKMLGDIYECSKSLSDEQDFLLNGTPVVKKKFTFDNEDENNTFPQSLGFMISDNINDGKINFGNNNVRRNLNTILEQQFDEQDEFTTVPNLNNS